MRVTPATLVNAVITVVLPVEFGGMSRLRSPLSGLMSIQSRSPAASSVRLGTVESAPTEKFTIDARSSKSSLEVVMSIISSLVMLGLDDVTSLCCVLDALLLLLPPLPLLFDVDTTLLLLELALLRLMDNVVEDMELATEDGELRFKSVMPLLLLFVGDSTGSMVSEEPMDTVVNPAGTG